ncbi:MAG: DUF488 domain-containing protein [Nanoarchaeota archaeon]
MELWTIGHSTRNFDTFVDILRKHRIETVVDVRHFPSSQRMPWFKKEYLELMLPKYRISYQHMGELGGYRKGGFAAFTKTKEFAVGMTKLTDSALTSNAAIMCAESVASRCHRHHIADSLVADGWTVNHILDENRVERHTTVQNE